jgi:hypothetical protein
MARFVLSSGIFAADFITLNFELPIDATQNAQESELQIATISKE